ncbi:MAG: class I SAM-dependent methyltransferase [Rhodospirillales bacterium]|jgi:SAM-dependent methyltransferase|nr:class I SAM-dependent methyltransferase [Rhodospirillales bacterium]MDP6884223.1 class I SAM-dependent methyltransferase [Rhodospirillales bacterium]
MTSSGTIEPQPWVRRFAPLVAPGGVVLDVACGGGRHARHFLSRGHPVLCLDRDVSGVADLASQPRAEIVEADLEGGGPWPLAARTFAGIVVVNYLYRPILPDLVEALAPGGVLIYETFGRGNERFGRPRRPQYLLRSGELLDLGSGRLQVVAYEHGIAAGNSHSKVVQRLCAVNDGGTATGGDCDPYAINPPDNG